MKRLLALTIASAMVLTLGACGAKPAEPAASSAAPEAPAASTDAAAPAASADAAAPAASGEKITVAGMVFQDDQFMNSLTKGYQDAAKDAGVECLTANSTNDQAKEVELINTYMTQGVNGIAIAPLDPASSIAALKEADSKGMKVSITNMAIDTADFIVGGYTSNDEVNGKAVGKAAAEFIKTTFPDQTVKVGLIHFDHQLPAQSKQRYGGFFASLDEAGIKYEIVANQGAEKPDTALQAASDMLTANPDIQIFYGANEGGTIGAVMGIEQAGLAGKCYAFGYDGSDQTTSMILNDTNILQAVVAQDPYNMGYLAMELLIKNLKGEDTAAFTGKVESVPGLVLSRTDAAAVTQWRTDNGL